MKSILIISENFYPEEFGINNFAKYFSEKGYEIKVLTQSPTYPYGNVYEGYNNKLFEEDRHDNIKIFRVKSLNNKQKNTFNKVLGYLYFSILSTIFIFRSIGKTKHVFVYQVGPLTQIIPAIFAKVFFKSKIFLWVLDLWPNTVFSYGFKKNKFNNLILNFFCKMSYKFCDKIFVSNEGFIDQISNFGISANKLIFNPQWIPNEINFNESKSNLLNPNKLNFTFAGNIGTVQNLEIIVNAFGKMKGNFILNIIGDGANLNKLKSIVSKKLYNNIIFWGRKPINEISSWLSSSDILIISLKDKDNFNLTVPAKFQAYLGAKKPIFCIIKGETSRIVAKYNLGLSSDPNSIEEIQSSIKKFISFNKNDLKTFAAKSQFLINNTYDFSSIMLKFENNIFKK